MPSYNFDYEDENVYEEIERDLKKIYVGEDQLAYLNDILSDIQLKKEERKTALSIYTDSGDLFKQSVKDITDKIRILDNLKRKIQILRKPIFNTYKKLKSGK